MRTTALYPVLFAAALAACAKDPAGPAASGAGLRIVNAYVHPVDVLVDGTLAASAVAAGALDSVAPATGVHTVVLRETGTATARSIQVSTSATGMRTVIALVSGGSLGASFVDDTNGVVPAGATKVRVLHLAPNAGEIQVFRTQPDWSTPIEWQFPFLYDSLLADPLAHPFLQSTVGAWDVRAWRKPSEVSLGWGGTTARATFTLASGEKRTVLVLDKPGGGIRLEVIE